MQWISIICAMLLTVSCSQKTGVGEFEGYTNVGEILKKGTAQYNAGEQEYKLTGGGANVWGTSDAFYFLWKKVPGDVKLSADVRWVGTGKNPHRKAGWMIRAGLEEDSPYADAVVHGDGLISLQYRSTAGGPTKEIQSPSSAPAKIILERHGDVFSLGIAKDENSFQPVGSISIVLPESVYVGLMVCSHEAEITETAVFTKVRIENPGTFSKDDRIVESTLEAVSIETGERRIVYRARDHFEAPNWTRDGKFLIFNSSGRLYTLPASGGKPEMLNTGSADRCNNDHGLSPDGESLAISHSPGRQSLIYILPRKGGEPRLVTTLGPSYWHGWSPDGKTLTYCASRNDEYDVYTISVNGGKEKRLTDAPGLDDGPDYSPDGNYIYFNSVRTGVMQIWRMKPDGSGEERVTFDEEYADWFPHPSPDGKWLVFLSYDKSVKGHPANKDVQLRIMPLNGGEPKILARLFGGQGTINVPSWSPDSKSLAFVSYRQIGR